MSNIFRKILGKSIQPQDCNKQSKMLQDNNAVKQQGQAKTSESEVKTADLGPDPPPAYTSAPLLTKQDANVDSQYAFLQDFDTVFVIDDSGSMSGTYWRETADALAAIAPICTEQDKDGIDIYFLNHRNPYPTDSLGGYNNVTSASAVERIFRTVRPSGGTPTGSRLLALLKPYVLDIERAVQLRDQVKLPKPRNIIVITDGRAHDDPESAIVWVAQKLDQIYAEPWQVGIQFFQVGCERDAAEALRELDDALSEKHGIRDMVDTVPWSGVEGASLTAENIMKITMGAINRRLDRQNVSRKVPT